MSSGLYDRLVEIRPDEGSHRVALRAAVSVAVPLLVLWASGHLDWTIYATFGAFTSLFGRERYGVPRLRLQASMATVLTVVVVLAAAVGCSPERRWLAVPATAVVAFVGSLLADRLGSHPPGPLFTVFAFASVSSIPASPADIATAAAVSAAAAACALVIGNVGFVGRLVTRSPLPPRRGPAPRPAGLLPHAARIAGGVLLAGLVATSVGIGHPYWAMVSAVVPLASREAGAGLVRGVQRVVGTFAGLVVAAALLAGHLDGLGLIVVVVLLQALAEMAVGRNYALALVAITPLALLMVHLAAPTPESVLLRDRGLETLFGVGTGYLAGLALRRRPSSAGAAPADGPNGAAG